MTVLFILLKGCENLFDVVSIGSATVDVFADTNSEMIKFLTGNKEEDFIVYPSGTKILISKLQFTIGGGGTNTATSFSRLGLKTGFLGKLGKDENSFKVIHLLESENISFLGKREGQTGYSIILDSIEHDRTILTYKGSNDFLLEEDIDFSLLKTKWVYSSSMMGESFETIKKLFSKLHQQGIKLAFNPSSYQVKTGFENLKEILSKCSVIVMNKEEGQTLVGKTISEDELVFAIRQFPEQYVLITNGKEGVTLLHLDKLIKILPTPNLKVVESTGAGDAFASGFVAGLIKNLSLEDSLKLGMVQAESVIQAKGAKNNLLDFNSASKKMSGFKGRIISKQINSSDFKNSKIVLDEVKKTIQFQAPSDKVFKLINGNSISSLDELAYYLKFAEERDISRFFYSDGNDFAIWIKDVFGELDLAEKVAKEKNHFVISSILIDFLRRKKGDNYENKHS